MAYGDFKDLTRRKAPDKILRDKTSNIAKNTKYDEYQRWLNMKNINNDLLHWFINFLIKKILLVTLKMIIFETKIFIKKFKKRKIPSPFTDNIWGADLADMQLISKFNKGVRFSLYVIYIFSNYAWVIPLKDEKGITITNASQKVLKESNRKPNKIWLDKGSEFCNRQMKRWLEKNAIEMYSWHHEGKSVVAEKFKKILKNKINKYMTPI